MGINEDHKRFNEIVKGRIKEDFKKYITHEEMIGKSENEFIKIPVSKIKIPKFVYGSKDSGGVGQGEGQEGQKVPGQGEEAGDTAGEHTLEVEVEIEELAEILGKELELPRIKPKSAAKVEAYENKYNSVSDQGPKGLHHFKKTYKQALQRSISNGTYNPDDPVIIPVKRDFRYKAAKKVSKPATNAVVIYMMDVSGSMGEAQKKIVRMESFWINTWLKHNYKGLENRFIIHDAAAKEVDEQTFFNTSESGGTLISSAYKKALEIIDCDYSSDQWNIYLFHFSDGDNWSNDDTVLCKEIIKKEFTPKVNLFGYGQVESKYGSGQFIKDIKDDFSDNEVVVCSPIKDKSEIIRSIKDFLGKGN